MCPNILVLAQYNRMSNQYVITSYHVYRDL